MSNTPAESVPVAVPEAAVTETAKQPKKFDNVHKTVASKAKAFLNVFHSTGENIRGNINAALDGAGDAIAGRKSGEVSGRKSGEQPSRRSLEATSSAPTPAEAVTTETPAAKVAASAPAEAPAATSTSHEVALETNVATDAADEGSTAKRLPAGQFINLRLKRTMELVTRVGSLLRSKSTRTVESLGSTFNEGKQRASRRFSRAPKSSAAEADEAAASPVPAEIPLPDTPAANPTLLETAVQTSS